MKFIVTGAAGLIGSHLCDLLINSGHSVIGIDDLSFGSVENVNRDVDLHILDLSQESVLDKFSEIDFVFHVASYKKSFVSTTSSYRVMDVNFCMTKEVIRFVKTTRHKRMLFTSTSDVYGNSLNFDESEQLLLGPTNVQRYSYALSKIHSEQMILNEVGDNRMNAVIARIFGCASPRSNRSWSGGHVPMFIDRALRNEDILIHGDGLQTRSISHALDIANGLYSMYLNSDKLNGEVINIGTDEQMSVLDTAKVIIELTNSKSKIKFQDTTEIFKGYQEIKRRYANTAKAKSLIDYRINFRTIETIKEIIDEYRK